MTATREHPLHGVRLGVMERWILRHAPHPDRLHGLAIDDPDARVREQLRRAALRLEQKGLIVRERTQVYVRARDPRREGLVLRDGRFWEREDPSRAHALRRTVVWLSPFGYEIELRYRRWIAGGDPIRWEPETVRRARADASRAWRNERVRDVYIAVKEDDARDAVVRRAAEQRLRPIAPEDVVSGVDVEQWETAVAVAAHRAGDAATVADVWDAARALWADGDPEALAAERASIPRPRETAGARFRRQRRPRL